MDVTILTDSSKMFLLYLNLSCFDEKEIIPVV